MTQAPHTTAVTAARAEFARRADELGVRSWFVNSAAAVVRPLSTKQSVLSPGLRDALLAAAAECGDGGRPVTHAHASVVSLLALPESDGVIVVDLSDQADGATAHGRLIRVLTHYHADVTQAASDARSIEGFNQQLSQSYEEVNLIYRMAKLLTSSGDPRQAVQSMCDELRATLGYGWLAMRFDGGENVLESLRDTLMHAGPLPCAPAEFIAASVSIDPTKSGKVLPAADHALAARAGSELLTERVTHNASPVGLLVAGNRQGVDPDVSSNELQLVEAAANFLGLYHQNAFRFAEQRQQFLGTLHALSAAVDAKDPYTHGHSERVGWLAARLAEKIGLPPQTVEAVRVAGLLHDIGKIGVPEAVLCKPGRLTDEEFRLIKQHPAIGFEILKNLPSLAFHLPGVLHHHERWDGRGYPHQLSGEQVPLVARVLALADTFDAMSSNRSYRTALDRSHVLNEFRKSSGTQFDPALVEPFVGLDFAAFDAMLAAKSAS